MSEKPTAAKLIEFKKSKEAARESEEDACSKKEQIPLSKSSSISQIAEKAEESEIHAVMSEIYKPEKRKPLEINEEIITKVLTESCYLGYSRREYEDSKVSSQDREAIEFFRQASSVKLEQPNFLELRSKSEICSESSTSKSEFHKVPEVSQKLHPKTTSEMSTSKLEAPEISDVTKMCQRLFETYRASISDKSEDHQVPETCQTTYETSIYKKTEDPEVPEIRRTHSMSKISDKTEEPEIPEVRRTHSTAAEISVPIKFVEDVEEAIRPPLISTSKSGDEKEISKSIEDAKKTMEEAEESEWRTIVLPISTFDKSNKLKTTKINEEILFNAKALFEACEDIEDDDSIKLEESSFKDTKSADDTGETKMTSIIGKKLAQKEQYEMFTRKIWAPMSAPNFKKPHLVLATYHMVPSLPIALFEILAEMIEVVTKRPVVLLHECREDRPIATEIVDIVVLPAYEMWGNGVLLPASFVFEHHLNMGNTALMYADVIVTNDRAPHIKTIMDLRGHRCAIPDERGDLSAAGSLFNHLYLKGENILFFGTVLNAGTQPEVLKMVASKQAEVGIVESPVLRYYKNSRSDMESIHVLTSIGPLPPYRIMIKDTLADRLIGKLTTYLLDAKKCREWVERLSPFGILGFDKNSMDYYKIVHKKRMIDVNIPYY